MYFINSISASHLFQPRCQNDNLSSSSGSLIPRYSSSCVSSPKQHLARRLILLQRARSFMGRACRLLCCMFEATFLGSFREPFPIELVLTTANSSIYRHPSIVAGLENDFQRGISSKDYPQHLRKITKYVVPVELHSSIAEFIQRIQRVQDNCLAMHHQERTRQ